MRKIVIKTLFTLHFFTKVYSSDISINDMSLEEKIGQLLIVQFRGDQINENAIFLIKNLHVGGFIYYKFANKLVSPTQVKNLSTSLQQQANETRLSIPLFICIDQEGGLINHLNTGFTHFPGNRALAVGNDPILAKLSAYCIGRELKSVGINMNLSPVVDINTNPKNPIIGIRSFDNCPEKVAEFAKMVIKGYHQAKVITSLKHFPGHGDVEIDSHIDLPILNKAKHDLEMCELIPFLKLAKDADTIMTAHLLVPSIDPENCATFSKKILDLLRNDMDYQGVIISDSLGMNGFLTNCKSRSDAAIKAINAGCDLLILGGDQINIKNTQEVYHALLDAAYNDQISLDRINESVKRILKLKQKYPLISQEKGNINLLEHQNLARKIAEKALITQKNSPLNCLQNLSNISIFAPSQCFDKFDKCCLDIRKKTFFYDENLSFEDTHLLLNKAQNSDLLIIFLYDTWKSKTQIDLVKSLMNRKKPVVLITLKNPIDGDLFSDAYFTVHTHSPTTLSIQAAYDKVCKIINSYEIQSKYSSQ